MHTPFLRVEKIGGTSMSRFPEIIDNIILRDPDDIYGRIYIVSAYSGITNELLEHKKTGKPGIYQLFKEQQNYPRKLLDLRDNLFKLNEALTPVGLDLDEANDFIGDHIDLTINILRSMDNVLSSGYVSHKALLLAAREMLASLGEMHSAFNSANILKNQGYNSTFIDLSGWEDSRQLTIDERIKDSFNSIDPFSTICFATGYTKGKEGIMREFDRGYSEVTFSKVAVLLGAKEAIIHKEYHLCSGDPLVIGEDKIHPVCNTNFDVADQLADVGMEAIHPKASKPLEINNIPIRIKNAFDPNHSGTLITKDFIAPRSKVEIVTGSDKVVSMEIHDTRMVGEVGFDLRIMQVLAKHQVSYISKATNANTIAMLIADRDCSQALLDDLSDKFESVTSRPVAIVCAIGSNIGQPGILARAAQSLAADDINILAVSQTPRQTNMQFIVERVQFAQAQRALHQALCM
ncbi:aspartate kinase [Desulfoprunum benzoelyticum]|uniref:aspartate kinase n=1 Tax=Desulfoprunum benzoelyticum TaxID=1506996 RepID=A0A840UXA1_9BACT|nr:aspartate kinase [Desulfoprunum benzoelyticum]MBB5349446.1 aspartate kinase [Desulfoprunum benzoelyticum]MBM9531697.1 aspartate kinase [Desulfoprunum benzoelyticum]